MSILIAAIFIFIVTTISSPILPINKDAALKGRTYNGIGGLSNSCAPWLKSYPEPQRSHILDYLFLPNFAASLQILKIEIGGDGHSTINTEVSHMHNSTDLNYKRGWEWWLMQEAKRRNPDIIIVALAWSSPSWVGNLCSDNAPAYLINWVSGAKKEYGIAVDYLGIHNEGGVPSSTCVIALRSALDTAGFHDTKIVSPDTHDFSIVKGLKDHSTEYFRSLSVLGIHEPLRGSESVPDEAILTGKPIWSSEAYTTYSDSNGGGCWARALNWGYVKGNVTAHIAWNLIQSYPSVGSGMNYNGHGLMWAEVPWSGHYTVNSPIWVSAHYTQATSPGWRYLPVGQGSGELPLGGTFVTLVPDPQLEPKLKDFCLIIQTMEYDNSKCFKDSHAKFSISNQTAQFRLSSELIPSTNDPLYVRKTVLYRYDPIDPVRDFPPSQQRNVYFERQADIIPNKDGTFSIDLEVNSVVSISTLPGGGNKGSHVIPPATPFFTKYCDNLTHYEVGSGGRFFIDQQGVWEAAMSIDGYGTTLQQTVPEEPYEWHSWSKLVHPHTFIGPSVLSANISCSVLPRGNGFAGVGVGPQILDHVPGSRVLAIYTNGTWSINGQSGIINQTKSNSARWYNLSLHVDITGKFVSWIDGSKIASGIFSHSKGWFPLLAASYATKGIAAEFKFLCIEGIPTPIPPTPLPPVPSPTPAPPPPGVGLQIAACNPTDPRQLWTFSGEDQGESGTLRPNSNVSMCINAISNTIPVVMSPCSTGKSDIQWLFNSTKKKIQSVVKTQCLVSKHGKLCYRCLDVMQNGTVDSFDCKNQDSNQYWSYVPDKGASLLQHAGRCLGLY